MRILFVDDEREITESAKAMLEKDGHQVTTMDDGLSAFEVLRTSPGGFDLVISDIRMPNMPGLELLSRLKLYKIEVPVVMVTGHGNMETAISAMKGEAFDFMPKPVTRAQLRMVIDRVQQQFPTAETANLYPFMSSTHEWVIDGSPESVKALCRAAESSCRDVFKQAKLSMREPIAALQESLKNATTHGSPTLNAPVTVRITTNSEKVQIQVQDTGPGFDWRAATSSSRNITTSPNKGLRRIRSLVSDVGFNDAGNRITMDFDLGSTAAKSLFSTTVTGAAAA